jgi:sulfopyruvate decarboxylase TPP-binding subunit
MFSLIENCGFPCLVLVTMRGEWEEFNPWQVPMGSITEECLRLAGFSTYRIDDPARVDEIVRIATDRAFNDDKAIAVILSQILIGKKDWR